ncbi:MAG: potassium transporter TrkG [Flavobacteriales bacterium]
MSVQSLREKINLFIYSSKERSLRRLKVISFFVSIIAIGTLFYYHGFHLDEGTNNWVQVIVEFSFGYYVFHYFAKIFYDFSPVQFIKQNWFEGVMVLILLIEGVMYNLFDVLIVQSIFDALGIGSASALSVVFLQFYLFLVVFFELSDKTNIISNIKLHPSTIFIFSFLVIIGAGTALLMMPEMTTDIGNMPFIDALFTSVSATCVTGLAAVDTATYFTFKGQFVIMMLMKLGGLNIVSFAYLAAFLNRAGFGMKQDDILEDFVTKDSFFNAKGMLFKVFGLSVVIELVGALFIYLLLTPDMPFSAEGDKIFFSIFHSISAFNNGGFSTVADGMYAVFLRDAYLIHIVVAALILLGAFGFTVLFDLFTPSLLRDRMKHPWKKPHMSTILAVRTHMILIVISVVLYMVAEWNNTLSENNFVESTIIATFQAISVRSAGLNTADIHALTTASVFLMIFMMFVGGNTFSTAGGIKTSTFALICINTYSIIRGKKKVEVLGRTIPNDDMLKAFTVLITFGGGMVICTYILTFTETHILAMPDRSFIDLLYEEVSAFSTCGYSTGITGMLSSPGKVVLILSMFIGRLGTLSIIFAFARKILTTNYSYPEEHLMVG